MTGDFLLPLRREEEVRLARTRAQALKSGGDLAGALAACAAARYSLNAAGGDDFIDHELPWLIEAGEFDLAGQRAFTDIYFPAHFMWDGTPAIVHERLADPDDQSVWWPLCVMRACYDAAVFGLLLGPVHGDGRDARALSPVHAKIFAGLDLGASLETRRAVFAAAHSVAEQRAPGHPWTIRLAAVNDGDAGRIDNATAFARLSAAAKAGGMCDSRTATALFVFQARAEGLMETLTQPPPSLPSGNWAYHYACGIKDYVADLARSAPAEDRAWIEKRTVDYQRAVYEQGRACMERYFETGAGHVYDASPHLYSMLCNNLAIIYDFDDDRPGDALELHRRGIAASPFAEHYAGAMRCLRHLDDAKGVVEAGDDLWRFGVEYGHGEDGLNKYVADVVWGLYELDRFDEMPLWVERLETWQAQNGGDQNLSRSGLATRLNLVVYLAYKSRDRASALWQRIEHQVKDTGDLWIARRAGDALHWLQRRPEAKVFYERSLALNPRNTSFQRATAKACEDRLELYRTETSPAPTTPPPPSKRSWKFW